MQKRAKKKVHIERSMLKTQIFVGIAIMFVSGLLVTGVWYGSRIDSLQITQVEVIGGYTIPHSEVEQRVQQRLVGAYFKLIPHTFTATYPKGAIVASLQDIPRIKNVHIEVVDTQKIVVVFEEYRPAALWCENYDTKECFFLDEHGFAFSQAPALTGSAFVRYLNNEHTPEEKQQAFHIDFMKSTQSFVDMLASELDLYVTHIEKVTDQDVLYTVSGGGVLKVSQMIPTENSFKNLQSILGSEDFIHLQNGKFQYIDLRFGDKIFLNEEEVMEEVATSTDQ